MLKNLYAVVALACFILFCCPLNLIKGEVTISNKEKSAGDFLTAYKTDASSFIDANGVSFSLTDSELSELLKDIKCKKVHAFFDGEILNVYYYSNKIPIKEVIKNQRVNVHVAISNQKITVGIPIIYYGY